MLPNNTQDVVVLANNPHWMSAVHLHPLHSLSICLVSLHWLEFEVVPKNNI